MPRFNCCVFNHPCPIFCPFVNLQCSNEVLNPVISTGFAFLTNTGGSFVAGGVIPLTLTSGAIMQASGGVQLGAGTYEINYFAGGTIPGNGVLSIALSVNGTVDTQSVVSVSGTAGNFANLQRTIVITVPQNSILTLVNNSSSAVTFSQTSMFVRQL